MPLRNSGLTPKTIEASDCRVYESHFSSVALGVNALLLGILHVTQMNYLTVVDTCLIKNPFSHSMVLNDNFISQNQVYIYLILGTVVLLLTSKILLSCEARVASIKQYIIFKS